MSIFKKAHETSLRAAKEGFDWDHWNGAYEKVAEELEEVRQEALKHQTAPEPALIEEFGDLIFAIMALARHLNIDPEEACEVGINKFEKRYSEYKILAESRGIDILTSSEQELNLLWKDYKKTLQLDD